MAVSRTAVIKVAERYINSGLVAHNPKGVPLAKDAFRTENGWNTGRTGPEIAERLPPMVTITGVKNVKWIVEGQEALAMFTLVSGAEIPVFEYFHVSTAAGNIKEVRPTFPSQPRPPAPPSDVAAPPSPGTIVIRIGPAEQRALKFPRAAKVHTAERRAAVALCNSYMKGLQAHDLGKVKFGNDVSVFENGKLVAHGIVSLGHWAATSTPSQIKELAVQDWLVEGPDVLAFYAMQTKDGLYWWGTQYFRIYGGAIRELQTTWGSAPTPEQIAAAAKAQPKKR